MGISDLFTFERAEKAKRPGILVAGVDEAGRGPLAGPVVAAAVILPPEEEFDLPVDDSKALSEEVREELGERLRADSRIIWAVAERSAQVIDRINILKATHEAMREAVRSLKVCPDIAFVDGLKVRDFPVEAKFIVKGDARSASIAAASILAKTHRDHLMMELDKLYPGYGFAKHKGYGTAQHLEALRELGPCPEHRRTFGPVARIIAPPPEQLELGL
ncbi:MAG: ribonuclease HII [Victivallales bacterium]|nr:ribonuclease HII [Victivallales bacterium]